ncbi:hypothetical protein D9M72_558530 [compost metagenome]
MTFEDQRATIGLYQAVRARQLGRDRCRRAGTSERSIAYAHAAFTASGVKHNFIAGDPIAVGDELHAGDGHRSCAIVNGHYAGIALENGECWRFVRAVDRAVACCPALVAALPGSTTAVDRAIVVPRSVFTVPIDQ